MLYTSGAVTTIDQKIAELFNNNFGKGGEWSWGNLLLCIISIVLSVILCGLVGLEREKRGRSAGLRTHLLVGVGSTIVMIISIYGFPSFAEDRDVARLAAQVVTGVGFLGAGAIIHNNAGIKGLTTASTIWLVMAIGLACGSMNFILAIAGTAVVMVVLILFRKWERVLTRKNPIVILLVKNTVPVMTEVLTVSDKLGYTVSDVKSEMVQDGEVSCIELTFRLNGEDGKEVDPTLFRNELEKRAEIRSIKTLNHR